MQAKTKLINYYEETIIEDVATIPSDFKNVSVCYDGGRFSLCFDQQVIISTMNVGIDFSFEIVLPDK